MGLKAVFFRAAVAISMGCGAAQAVDIEIVYLERQVAAPPILSNLERAPEDTGLAGARLAVAENNTTGQFLGQTYALTEVIVPEDKPFDPGAIAALAGGGAVVVAHMPAEDLLALADWSGAEGMVIFNGSARDDALRRAECRGGVMHTIPSDAMRADALAQFMLKRRWTDWLLITGEGPGDAGYAAALRAAAAKFNATITGEKTWRFDADMRRNAAQEVPLLTQEEDYDAVVVVDEIRDWGRYVLYNTWLPRPVIGSEGLRAVAWSPVVEQWGAAQLQRRFVKSAGRGMGSVDYALWAAVRAVGEAVTRTKSDDPAVLRDYLLSDAFELAGFKGRKMTFRSWNGQMRQPIPLVHSDAIAALAPIEGFLHQKTELDTLGQDEAESACDQFR